MVGPEARKQGRGNRGLVTCGGGQRGVFQHPRVVTRLHLFGRGRLGPFGHHLGTLQQALRLAELGRGHDQRRNPLGPRPPGAPGSVQQGFRVAGQIGVDHQIQPRQINPARRDIGRDADPRPAIAQALQRVGAFLL